MQKPHLVAFGTLSLIVLLSCILIPVAGADMTGSEDGEVATIDYPETVGPNSEFEITVETISSAGTVVEIDPEGLEVDISSEEAVHIENNRVEFLDPSEGPSTHSITVSTDDSTGGEAIEFTAWVNAEVPDEADDVASSTLTITPESKIGEVVEIEHPEVIKPTEQFDFDITTSSSAGTVVQINTDGFDVDLSSEEAVNIKDNQVEFLDPSAGESTHSVTVDPTGGTAGDTIVATVWVNAEDRAEAHDVESSTVTTEDIPPVELEIDNESSTLDVYKNDTIEAVSQVTNPADSQQMTEVTATAGGTTHTQTLTLDPNTTKTVEFDFIAQPALDNEELTVTTGAQTATAPLTVQKQSSQEANFTATLTDVPSDGTIGEELTVEYEIENTGSVAGTQQISQTVNGGAHGTEELTLDPGETTISTFAYTPTADQTPGLDVGVHSANDTETTNVEVLAPATFDIVNHDLGDTEIENGTELIVEATVENSGDQTETQEIEWQFTDQVIATEHLELDPEATETIEFSAFINQTPGEYSHQITTNDDRVEQQIEVSEPDSIPGFGIGATATALVGAAYLLQRRLTEIDEME